MQHNPLYSFLFKAALWLPPCLALWYWLADWVNTPVAMVAGWVMRGLFSWVEAVEWSQHTLTLVTSLRVSDVQGPEGQVAMMVAETNPMLYSFGLPMFAALILASGGPGLWRKLLLGAVILIPFQTWGICFDLLKQVAISAGPAVADQTGLAAWQRESVALGYQLGYLILPTLSPVALWLAFSRQFIPMLMLEGALRHEERGEAKPGGPLPPK